MLLPCMYQSFSSRGRMCVCSDVRMCKLVSVFGGRVLSYNTTPILILPLLLTYGLFRHCAPHRSASIRSVAHARFIRRKWNSSTTIAPATCLHQTGTAIEYNSIREYWTYLPSGLRRGARVRSSSLCFGRGDDWKFFCGINQGAGFQFLSVSSVLSVEITVAAYKSKIRFRFEKGTGVELQ